MDDLTFDIVINDTLGHDIFSKHLVREFSTENIEFYDTVLGYRVACQAVDASEETMKEYATSIMDTYIYQGSMSEVNIPSTMRKRIEASFASGTIDIEGERGISATLFDAAFEEVYKLMARDSYAR